MHLEEVEVGVPNAEPSAHESWVTCEKAYGASSHLKGTKNSQKAKNLDPTSSMPSNTLLVQPLTDFPAV